MDTGGHPIGAVAPSTEDSSDFGELHAVLARSRHHEVSRGAPHTSKPSVDAANNDNGDSVTSTTTTTTTLVEHLLDEADSGRAGHYGWWDMAVGLVLDGLAVHDAALLAAVRDVVREAPGRSVIGDISLEDDKGAATTHGTPEDVERYVGADDEQDDPQQYPQALLDGMAESLSLVIREGISRAIPHDAVISGTTPAKMLAHLKSHPGSSSKDMAAALSCSPEHVSRSAKQLVALGLLLRGRNGKAVAWRLSPRGQTAADALPDDKSTSPTPSAPADAVSARPHAAHSNESTVLDLISDLDKGFDQSKVRTKLEQHRRQFIDARAAVMVKTPDMQVA